MGKAKTSGQDKFTAQLLDALRASLDGNSRRLQGSGANRGVFAGGQGGSKLAKHALSEGLLEEVPAPQVAGTKPSKAKPPVYAKITGKGRQFVLDLESPKKILEALHAAVEHQGKEISGGIHGLEQCLVGWQETLRTVLHTVQTIGQRSPPPQAITPQDGKSSEGWEEDVVKIIAEAKQHNSFARPTLSTVYAQLRKTRPGLTLGQFHDGLRTLQKQQRIRLTAYTQALATLEDAQNALYLDREVKYYVDLP